MGDKKIPTFPIKLVGKRHVSASGKGSAVIETTTIPRHKVGQLTVQKLFTSSADTWFKTDHTVGGTTNTKDREYLEAAGGIQLSGNVHEPLASFPGGSAGGTVKVKVENPGSAQDYGVTYRIDLV